MDLHLKDKVVLVTGSGDGIGRRTIMMFAEEGARVIVNDIVSDKAERVAAEAKTFGVAAVSIIADVTRPGEVGEMVTKIFRKFGKLDILVNNAFAWDKKPFSQSLREEWAAPIDVCLWGTLHCCHAVINQMKNQKYGKIISVVSDAGGVGEKDSPVYSAAKAGVIAFSKSLAREVGKDNVNVNCVSAGATQTGRRIREHQEEWERAGEKERERICRRDQAQLRLYPMGRWGEPEDVAAMIVFLASDRAKHITGQVISVNGGYSMIS
jgi:2-hydroxycyclohexanecarboxyl-CoA dehydrogenase